MSNQNKNLLPQLFEPLAITAIILLFIVPAVTVLNLSPITQTIKKPNVLGATDSEKALTINMVGGSHNIFSKERLQENTANSYIYTVEAQKRTARKDYSKPIVEISNGKNSKATLSVYGYTDSNIDTNIIIKTNKENYVLRDSSKEVYTRKITLEPNSKVRLYMSIQNTEDTLFPENISVIFTVQ